jgi:MFS family permease
MLASSWVTKLGDGITLAAGPLLVASQTDNPLAVAMATFPQRLPWLLFGLYAGVIADRLNRRAIVITTGLVRVAILLLLTATILTHRVGIAVVLAALFLFRLTTARSRAPRGRPARRPAACADRRQYLFATNRSWAGNFVRISVP